MTSILSTNILHYFQMGGVFMFPILILSIVGSVIFAERFLAFRYRYGLDARKILNEVKKYLHANDLNRAIETTRQYPLSPVSQVMGAGLANVSRPIDEVDTAMEAEALYYVPKITARTQYLALFANLATLLGLLGTISGLISSFAGLSGSAELGLTREEALAAGISEALICTAFGLIVAVPMLLLHQYIVNQSNALLDEIQHYATALKKLVQRMKDEKGEHVGLKDFQEEEGSAKESKARSR